MAYNIVFELLFQNYQIYRLPEALQLPPTHLQATYFYIHFIFN